ncbi:MAG: hypothetical protein CVU19_02735 [Betaproteobacteria bacterium HGW-Betaproteobacteria-13]|jgi:hypothetical protein|nr:MAG: hypothetical protein CVU19_02735 [Betaproteobacteria bacterium HGW-Betaproteobacteria-13]
MDMSKLHLHIEHLSVPAGFSPAQQRAYLAALEQQLAASIASGTLPTLPGSTASSLKVTTTDDMQATNLARKTVAALAPTPAEGSPRRRGSRS